MTTPTNKFKIRAANYSADELECLLSHLEANPGLLDAKIGGQFNSAEEYKQAWEEVAEKVSEVGGYFGVKRTGHDVKKKWSDLKHRVKTKVASIAMESESGIHGTSVKLNPVDERVFTLITQMQENQPDNKYVRSIEVKGPALRVFSFQHDSSSNAAGNSDQEDAESSQIESELVNEIKATTSEEKKRRLSEAFHASNDRGGIQLKRAKQLTDEEQLLELCVSQKQIITELSSVKDILKKCQQSIEKLAILKRAELQLKCAKHGVEFDDLFV